MHEFIAWCAFLGAWLLFAGPVYQAAVELTDDQFNSGEVGVLKHQHPERRVSKWWWLLPPVWYVKQRKESQQGRQQLIDSLSSEGKQTLADYLSTATGWMYVGAGAGLIAVKETYDLVELHEWPVWLFWVLIFGVSSGCVALTARRIESLKRFARQKRDRAA